MIDGMLQNMVHEYLFRSIGRGAVLSETDLICEALPGALEENIFLCKGRFTKVVCRTYSTLQNMGQEYLFRSARACRRMKKQLVAIRTVVRVCWASARACRRMKKQLVATRTVVRVCWASARACRRMKKQLVAKRTVVRVCWASARACRRMEKQLVATRAVVRVCWASARACRRKKKQLVATRTVEIGRAHV